MSMEKSAIKSNQNLCFPRRKGQIKMKILKSMVKSAVGLASMRSQSGRGGSGSGSGSSTPSTATPSGYDSDR
uniref:Putative ovule protein n=1 Tax=Solanum chacoense TaxID=4108 RepID=A0A0V0GP53_SOLCH